MSRPSRPPTTPSPMVVSRKRPITEALELTPLVTPYPTPCALVQEPVPPPKTIIVGIPMVYQEPPIPLQALASNSKSYRNFLAHECKHRQKALLVEHAASQQEEEKTAPISGLPMVSPSSLPIISLQLDSLLTSITITNAPNPK